MAWFSTPLKRIGRLPAARTPRVRIHRDVETPGADGVLLLGDLYRPTGVGSPLPTLLVRSPYGRRGKWGAVYGQLFAERGYNVLVQSTRGTYGSGGAFEPMIHEAADGHATVGWMRDQPWFCGELVVMGSSYLAFAGWAIASDPPPELRGLASFVGPHEWRSVIYPNGAFALDFALTWTANRLQGDDPDSFLLNLLRRRPDVRERVGSCFGELPLAKACDQALAGRGTWLQRWLEHGADDEAYWRSYDAGSALDLVNVPVLLLGGWQDLFLRQTLEQYRILTGRGVPVALTIGPWTHRGLEKDWSGMVSRAMTWLDSIFTGPVQRPTHEVEAYVGGAERWVRLPTWPVADLEKQQWHLQPGGGLSLAEPPEAVGSESFTYDPASPTPTIGGATTRADAGPQDNRVLEERPDVLTYTSPPLAGDMQLLGVPVVSLRVSSSAESFDCFVRLCVVAADGTSINVCDGISRVADVAVNTAATITVPLSATAHLVPRGHCLRLLVSGGSHPQYARNPGTGESAGDAVVMMVAVTRLHYEPGYPLTITLDVETAALEDWSAATPSSRDHHRATSTR